MSLKKLFVEETDNTFIQFFRYLLVGGFATVVDWGLSALLFYMVFGQNDAILCNGTSFVAGLVVNYFLSTFWIFKNSKISNRFLEFLSFAAIGVVGLVLTLVITWGFEALLKDVTSLYQMIAKVVSTAVSFFWNFFARKFLLFDKKHNEEEHQNSSDVGNE
ncbi:MAG: GtrA family protein [Clostridia bacterium]|nr:GtrA family protein [Clostridia bacterium]